MKGMEKQNWERSLSADIEICAYRGTRGRKCVIGQVLPDNFVVEGQRIDRISRGLSPAERRRFDKLFPPETIEFASTLQDIHDIALDSTSLYNAFKVFAATHRLPFPYKEPT
jgi:hypothetical protein